MRLLLLVAGLVVVTCLAIHVSTFTSVDAVDHVPHPAVLGLASVLMLLAAAVVNPQLVARQDEGKRKRSLREVFDRAPRWAVAMVVTVFLYGVVNFLVFMATDAGGEARRGADGGFELTSHGKVLRQIDEAEFHRVRKAHLRGLSGHSLALSTFAFTGILGAYCRMRQPAGALDLHPVGWRSNFQNSRSRRSRSGRSLR